MRIVIIVFIVGLSVASCGAKPKNSFLKVGAERTELYIPLLEDKKVGLVANHTSLVGQGRVHLLDTLYSMGVSVLRVFAPEHGFRGSADAGELVDAEVDRKTGVEITSIYGKSKKPSKKQLEGIDIMVFDMQDVGTRFFTYLSTMHYVMEACAENNIPLIVLDRPNPNGGYVDGPILEMTHSSFVGMHPIPIVHGMTLGELAQMINGEGWLKNGARCKLNIISCESYAREMAYELPVNPSPNLPNMRSIYLYPSLCLFEGTIMSVGRGTDFPFQVFGHPNWQDKHFEFTPRSITGAAKHPLYEGRLCFGEDLRSINIDTLRDKRIIDLDYLITAYGDFKDTDSKFFIPFFTKLAGTKSLQSQIEKGMNSAQIHTLWQKDIEMFKRQREPYLIYR